MTASVRSIPQPRLAFVRWLSAPVRHAGEGDAELRSSMFRRIEAILASAAVTLIVVALAAQHHRTIAFDIWLAIEIVLFVVRAPLCLHIIHVLRHPKRAIPFHPWSIDLFIIAGTVWSAVLGFGCFISLATQDPGLSVLISLLAIGTASGQCARNPSSPRLNSVQMCLIIFPFTAGAYCSAIPLVGWCLLLIPLYLTGMLSITLQLHEDYVTMIMARIEHRKRALHCALTGLPNRVFFHDSLQLRLEQATASRTWVAVLCLDLDGFKAVNDEFGHPMGDVLLQHVAHRLRALMNSNDMPARLGGDEFAVLIGDPADGERLAARIIAALGEPFALTAQHKARIGVSVGMAIARGGRQMTDKAALVQLLDEADKALYAAKRAGRGLFCRYDALESTCNAMPEPTAGRGGPMRLKVS